MPYNFITTLENLLNSLNELENNIPNILNNSLVNLNNDISKFLNGSRSYVSGILNHVINITNFLNSKDNKVYEAFLYYISYKKFYYSEIISYYENIILDYYKKEKDTILPFIKDILDIFYGRSIFFIQRFNDKLGNILERVTKNDLK